MHLDLQCEKQKIQLGNRNTFSLCCSSSNNECVKTTEKFYHSWTMNMLYTVQDIITSVQAVHLTRAAFHICNRWNVLGPVDLDWACPFFADFWPEFYFTDFFTFSQRFSQRFSFVKVKSITYVQNELFSGLKLTNLGEFSLKGSDQWKMRRVWKLASVRRWFWTVAINVCLLFNVAVIFSWKYFRFLFVKPS